MQQPRQRQVRQSSANSQSDTLAILGMVALGILSVAMVLVVVARVLMDLPPEVAAAIVFSFLVFVVVCGAALLVRQDRRPAATQPPTGMFRKPRRVGR